VSTVITGVSRPEQARENAMTSELDPLPTDLHEKLAELYRQKIEAAIVVAI